MWIELISTCKALNQDSLWNRGEMQLKNGWFTSLKLLLLLLLIKIFKEGATLINSDDFQEVPRKVYWSQSWELYNYNTWVTHCCIAVNSMAQIALHSINWFSANWLQKTLSTASWCFIGLTLAKHNLPFCTDPCSYTKSLFSCRCLMMAVVWPAFLRCWR